MSKKSTTPFVKYSGSGNDFVIIDNRTGDHSYLQKNVTIQNICNRHEGIGADGVIFLESNATHSFAMRIFQPDGKEVEMCGNGLRCLGHYIHTLHPTLTTFSVATMHSALQITVDGSHVAIEMPKPTNLRIGDEFTIEEKNITLHTINTGVPHAVIFVEEIEMCDILELGRKIRHAPAFAPYGANVNFVKVISKTSLEIRTYERGVEGETQACGTGATAAAIITAKHHGYEGPISLKTRSRELLTVSIILRSGMEEIVMLKGSVRQTFTGNFFL